MERTLSETKHQLFIFVYELFMNCLIFMSVYELFMLSDPICGLPKYAPMTAARVVGGDKANSHLWPLWAMIICHSRTNSTLCGGSIVSDQWVLTAAHCM